MPRLFIAINLPSDIKDRLARFTRELQLPSARLTARENLHLTLAFLGEVDEKLLAKLTATLDHVTAEIPPFTVRLGGLGFFPEVRRPRVVWVGARGGPTFAHLAAVLCRELAARGFRVEDREFTAHITIARFLRGRRPPTIGERVGELIEDRRAVEIGNVVVESIDLMESALLPGGPRYSLIHSFKLGRGLR